MFSSFWSGLSPNAALSLLWLLKPNSVLLAFQWKNESLFRVLCACGETISHTQITAFESGLLPWSISVVVKIIITVWFHSLEQAGSAHNVFSIFSIAECLWAACNVIHITLCPSHLLSTLSNYCLTLWCKWGCSPPTCPDMLVNLFRHRTCNCSHQLSFSFSLCLSIIWNVSYYRQAFRYGSRNAVPIISSLSWDHALCWDPSVCIVTVWNEEQMQRKIKKQYFRPFNGLSWVI